MVPQAAARDGVSGTRLACPVSLGGRGLPRWQGEGSLWPLPREEGPCGGRHGGGQGRDRAKSAAACTGQVGGPPAGRAIPSCKPLTTDT